MGDSWIRHLALRLFYAFGRWVIERAQRTPYFHLTNADGTPYMDRFWLAKIGRAGTCRTTGEPLPWIGLRVHHIRSSDDGLHFHDHPWDFVSLILDGGYHEETPYDGLDGWAHLRTCPSGDIYTRETYLAPALLYRPADRWHRLRLLDSRSAPARGGSGAGTWTLVLTLPKRQKWGFRVNGHKVVHSEYFSMRARSEAALKMALALAKIRSAYRRA